MKNSLLSEMRPPLRPVLGGRMMSIGFLKLSGFGLGVTALDVEPRGSGACLNFQIPQWRMLVEQALGK